CQQYNSGPFTF
nr:immunoglobulin light chain junction region [Macaca mulatta]MOV78027.1 immunoglobulin light chain junction region [Macaca mulatta]MOV79001.1 immunoglobulin light chain junction region [Macaca mulatta]MOV79132.1 immunoglobulin light chain junction region [Macaca mulatta]MOV79627.1 immunoglobulin light chain junction region [Macaca mulatta]